MLINLTFNEFELPANLIIPQNPKGFIIFAHGSGSSVISSRNQMVAETLNKNAFGTLLFDLLTKVEKESDIKTQNIVGKIPGITLNKFNIKLLTKRLTLVTQWIQKNNDTSDLNIGYFGASTGATAALYAAATLNNVKALVSRGGRTDLVDKKTLRDVLCPCLFIVGSTDRNVINSNKKTMHYLTNAQNRKLEIIKGASHLFEEKGKLLQVAKLAVDWFKSSLGNIYS